jgi:hypothetical protein
METNTSSPNATNAKPVVTPIRDGQFRVQFPDGRSFVVFNEGRDYCWMMLGEHSGPSQGRCCDESVLWATIRAHGLTRPALFGSRDALESAIGMTLEKIDDDQAAFVKAIKRVLVARFGGRWSCTRGRGTAGAWCGVRPQDDTARLWARAARIESNIPPTRGYRAFELCRAAGVEPVGVALGEHSWD